MPCCGVKRIGNVNVNGNTFGNGNVGDDLYRGVEETCVSDSAGEHWIWKYGAPVRVSQPVASAAAHDAIMTHSQRSPLHCRMPADQLKWQLDASCKSKPLLVSQVRTAGGECRYSMNRVLII